MQQPSVYDHRPGPAPASCLDSLQVLVPLAPDLLLVGPGAEGVDVAIAGIQGLEHVHALDHTAQRHLPRSLAQPVAICSHAGMIGEGVRSARAVHDEASGGYSRCVLRTCQGDKQLRVPRVGSTACNMQPRT